MNNQPLTHFQTNVSLDAQDELQVLTRAFALPDLSYIDISRQELLIKMMVRWPLLAELAQK